VTGSAAYSGSPSTRRIAGQESQKEDAMPFSVRRRDALGIAGILFLAAVLPASAEDLGVTFAKSLYKLPKLWGDVIGTAAARQQYLASDLGAAIVENAKYSGDLDYAVDYDPLARFPNQVRHRLCPGSLWEQSTITSRLMRDAACAA
jgi:hypothetical protein